MEPDIEKGKNKAESLVRKTMLKISNACGAEKVNVFFDWGTHYPMTGVRGRHHDGWIEIDWLYCLLVAMHPRSKWNDDLRFIIAHEYGHSIIQQDDDGELFTALYKSGLFHYEDMQRVSFSYNFDDSEMVGYESMEMFIKDIKKHNYNDGVYPVEGFCNVLAQRATGVTSKFHASTKEEYSKLSNGIGMDIVPQDEPEPVGHYVDASWMGWSVEWEDAMKPIPESRRLPP